MIGEILTALFDSLRFAPIAFAMSLAFGYLLRSLGVVPQDPEDK